MGEFKIRSDDTPGGDQPQAIDKLVKGLEAGNRFQTLLGATGTGKTHDHSHHYRFLFDHQVNSDLFLTVSAEFRSHDSIELKDKIRANLDYRLVF